MCNVKLQIREVKLHWIFEFLWPNMYATTFKPSVCIIYILRRITDCRLVTVILWCRCVLWCVYRFRFRLIFKLIAKSENFFAKFLYQKAQQNLFSHWMSTPSAFGKIYMLACPTGGTQLIYNMLACNVLLPPDVAKWKKKKQRRRERDKDGQSKTKFFILHNNGWVFDIKWHIVYGGTRSTPVFNNYFCKILSK